MRPQIERPSKRYHTPWGDKIVTAIGLLFLIALLLFAVFAYQPIS